MKKGSSRRSNLLLMEIILSVLFFTAASTVCLQVFVRASLLEKDTRELDMAVRYVSSAAELLSRPEHAMEHLRTLYPDAQIEEQEAHIWFDKDFQSCQKDKSSYEMSIQSSSQDTHTIEWSVSISDGSKEIYQLKGTTYQQYMLSYGQ